MKIKVNRIRCTHCNDIIISKHEYDLKSCSCGKCQVDGGTLYLKRTADSREDYEELSECEEGS